MSVFQVTAVLNPECSPSVCKKDEVILVHVKAEGDDDTLHHLWDFTGKPSLMIALTDSNATLTVQWQSFQVGAENAVTFNPAPKYVYGTAFDKVDSLKVCCLFKNGKKYHLLGFLKYKRPIFEQYNFKNKITRTKLNVEIL